MLTYNESYKGTIQHRNEISFSNFIKLLNSYLWIGENQLKLDNYPNEY